MTPVVQQFRPAASGWSLPDRQHPALRDRCVGFEAYACDVLVVPLVVAYDAEHDSVVAGYRCSRCRRVWWTSYWRGTFA